MKKRIVITGLGAISAHGHSIETICARSGTPLPLEARLALTDKVNILPVRDLDTSIVGSRLRKKLDPFTIYGLCACNMALNDSGLAEADIDLERIGIFVGNCLGGWAFTEPELQKLHTIGVDAMSPYVATAWFPAALQGQISLRYGFKGYSKTYSASGVAGLQAVGYAVEAIERGYADAIVCGASEDLSSPYAHALLQAYDGGETSSHLVFGCEKHVEFAEGAAFIVIESYEHALKRGAPIYCEITGFSDHFCPGHAQRPLIHKKSLATVITRADSEHLFLMDGLFTEESSFFCQVANEIETPLTIAISKPAFGNMFAVSGVMELACIAHELGSGSVRGNLLGAEITPAKIFQNVIVQRLSIHGGMATLSVSAM